MRFKQIILILPFALCITLIACKAKKAATTEKAVVAPVPIAKVEVAKPSVCPQPVTFQTLQPLLSKSCTTSGCHDAYSYNMNFTQYAIIKQFAVEGEIKKHVLEIKNMPPNEKLTAQELALVKCWLDGGMLEK